MCEYFQSGDEPHVQVPQVNTSYIYEGRFSFYFLEVDLARNSSDQELKE